ncbi:MAG TPA: hypothetical protein VN969_44230 [Streptosporangiaceae bacterium]|nr:hypothetical protein [Streptosporangiaceae bacterium]
MKRSLRTRLLLASTIAVAALAGTGAAAVPASAANWNIPGNIRYPFYPACDTHMSPVYAGYGTMTCKGEYKVNRGNYQFTQDNTGSCPAMGKLQRITLDYVLNPASGGVTTTKTLAGFSMYW